MVPAYVLQELLTSYFQALQSSQTPGHDFRQLRVRSVELCLQQLSREHPKGDRLVALLRDQLVDIDPEAARKTIKEIIHLFGFEIVAPLQLLPPLLALAALPSEGGPATCRAHAELALQCSGEVLEWVSLRLQGMCMTTPLSLSMCPPLWRPLRGTGRRSTQPSCSAHWQSSACEFPICHLRMHALYIAAGAVHAIIRDITRRIMLHCTGRMQ